VRSQVFKYIAGFQLISMYHECFFFTLVVLFSVLFLPIVTFKEWHGNL